MQVKVGKVFLPGAIVTLLIAFTGLTGTAWSNEDASRRLVQASSQGEPGSDDPDTAARLNIQAVKYYLQGLYEKAEPLYERALAIREKMLGPKHPQTALSLHNLAMLYWAKGSYAKAGQLFRRALAIRATSLGSQHPDTAATLNMLGLLHNSQGLYAEAEPFFTSPWPSTKECLAPKIQLPQTVLTT